MPVYFIRAGEDGPVKIGLAVNVERRRKTLQTAHSAPLRMIRTIEGGRGTEQWLHQRFAEVWLKGEWFQFHPDMISIEPPQFARLRQNEAQRPQPLPVSDPQIELCEARSQAMRALRRAGWGYEHIALALGMRAAWEQAARWVAAE